MIGFNEPIVVDHAAESADVDEPVQRLPALAAQAANPTSGGGQRKGDQQYEAEEPHGDKGPLGHILPHAAEIESLVRPNVGEEVQANVEESEQAEHAAEANEVGKLQELAERRDGEGDEQEAQRPITGEVLDEFDRIGGEFAVTGAPA